MENNSLIWLIITGDLYGYEWSYHLVIKRGRLENLPTQWRLIDLKIIRTLWIVHCHV